MARWQRRVDRWAYKVSVYVIGEEEPVAVEVSSGAGGGTHVG